MVYVHDMYFSGKGDAHNTASGAEEIEFDSLRTEGLAIAERLRDDGEICDDNLAKFGDAWAHGYYDVWSCLRISYLAGIAHQIAIGNL